MRCYYGKHFNNFTVCKTRVKPPHDVKVQIYASAPQKCLRQGNTEKIWELYPSYVIRSPVRVLRGVSSIHDDNKNVHFSVTKYWPVHSIGEKTVCYSITWWHIIITKLCHVIIWWHIIVTKLCHSITWWHIIATKMCHGIMTHYCNKTVSQYHMMTHYYNKTATVSHDDTLL